MNKKILLLVLVLMPVLVSAQKITQSYHFEDYSVRKIDDYALIEFDKCLQIGSPGQAMMPYRAVKLLLPPGTEARSVKIRFSNPLAIEGEHTLYPKQYVRPVSQPAGGEFLFDEAFYQSSQICGESKRYPVSTEYMNGHSVAFAHFTPLRYVPAEGKLYYFQDIEVELTVQKSRIAENAFAMIQGTKSVKSRVAAFVDNADRLQKYPETNYSKSDNYEVLILSEAEYADDFEAMQAIYLYRGLRSEFKDVNEIYNSMSGVDEPEKIRNYIIQEYSQHGITHVVLAGDAEIVPYRGFYCEVQSSSLYTDDDIPSDLYYSALDGNWNTDGDNLWGEIGEDDLLPELSVARLPFSNSSELAKMLNKVSMYQENPVTDELNNPLLAGEHLYDDPLTWGSDYLELIIGYHDDNGYETTGIPETDPYGTLYASEQTWGKDQIIAAINSGHPFIHHVGHSNTTYTMYLYNSDITNSNFSQVNGTDHNFSLVYTHGCICGDFSADDCIAEEMLKIDNFAAGFIGNSRYGWFNEGQTEGPSAHIHREFMDALYDKKQNHIGTAHMISKYETAPWVNAPNQHEEGALRWCFYDCNALSDPTLPIWTDAPITIDADYENELSIGVPYFVSISSEGNPLEGMSCTVMKDGELLGSGITDEFGTAEIETNPVTATTGPAELIITGYNCQKTTYNITITNNPNAVVVVDEYEATDNNNGIPEYNEALSFNMNFRNAGAQDATNCTATLGSEDEYVSIAYCYANLGTIPAGSSVLSEGELCLAANAYVPDQHNVLLTVNTVCDQATWNQDINLTINAPDMDISGLEISETDGNGNGIFEGGETANFSFKIQNNGHSLSPEGTVYLTNPDGNIVISGNAINIGTVEGQSYTNAVFSISAPEELQNGDNYSLICQLNADEYSLAVQFNLVAGQSDEDFETGDFTAFDWQFGGSADWQIFDNESNTGNYSAGSADIDDDESSVLEITMEVLADSEISFSKKVSSESDYDYLRFYIDGTEQDKWSGEVIWSQESFPVMSGQHTFTWEYSKDFMVSSGDDMAWVDDIIFPMSGDTSHVALSHEEPETASMRVNCYPNPFRQTVSFDYRLEKPADVRLEIFNANGLLIDYIRKPQDAGHNRLIWETASRQAPGLYFWRLTAGDTVSSGKMVKTEK